MKAVTVKADTNLSDEINKYLDKGCTIFNISQVLGIQDCVNGAASYTYGYLIIFNKNGVQI